METSHILKRMCPPSKPNISWEESRAIKELKEDQSRVVLTADKGVDMVVLDREDYKDNAHLLLSDTNTYRPITKHLTKKLKNKLAQRLKDIKNQGWLNDNKYRKVYPTSVVAPIFYGLPKIHKICNPSCPLSPVGGPSHMGWPRNWPPPSVSWLASSNITSKTSNTLCNTSKRSSLSLERAWHLMMSRHSSAHFPWTPTST